MTARSIAVVSVTLLFAGIAAYFSTMDSTPKSDAGEAAKTQATPAIEKGPSVQITKLPNGVQEARLPNGLRIIIQEVHSSPVLSVQAWCAAGSITEDEFLGTGISHFVEHMLFKGTKNRGNSEMAQEIQALGGYTNAYTSFDRTVYYIDLPSKGWREGIDILSDAVFRSTFPAGEVGKEQEVIRREFAMGQDDPNRVLQKLLFSTAFQTHPYKYPVIGHLELFNQVDRDALISYYEENYTPSNVTFVLVGDVDAREVVDAFHEMTLDVPRKVAPNVLIQPEPRQLGRRENHRPFPTEVLRMYMAYHIPAITHEDVYPLDVLAIVAGQGTSSRLHRKLVEEKALFRGIDTFSYTPAQSGLWAVSAILKPGSTLTRSEAEKAIMEVLSEFKEKPISREELQKAKRQSIAARASELKTVSGRAGALGSSMFVANDLDFSSNYLEKLKNVTPEDVQRVARKYFSENNLTVVSLYPEDQKQDLESSKKDRIVSGLQAKKLDNGASLVMKQDTSVPLVTVRVIGKGGLLAETKEDNGIGRLAIRLLEQGTTSRSFEKIASEIENLGGSLGLDTGNNSFSISIEVLEEDLPIALDLLADITLNPAFKEEKIESERAKQLADLAIESDQPMAIARNHMRTGLYHDHPYGLNSLGTPESLASIKRDDLIAYHKKLITTGNLVFAIGGSFAQKEALALFNKHFPASKVPDGPPVYSPQQITFDVEGKMEEVPTEKVQAIVQVGFPTTTIESDDRPALDLLDQAMSDLASRLFIRIREEKALAYFVGAGQLVGPDPGYFLFYAGTEASKAKEVETEILAEVDHLIANGLSQEEIDRARAKLTGRKLLSDQAAGAVSYRGALNLLYGLGIDYEDRYNDAVQDLTTERIHDVVQKYFGERRFHGVIIQPTGGK